MSNLSGQPFERLVRLEDDELDTGYNEDDHNHESSDRDSCKVAMLPNGSDQIDDLDTIFEDTRHKPFVPTIYFTIHGRRIRIGPDHVKYLSLVALTAQNALLTLTMRAANTQRERFSPAVAVTIAEIFKMVSSFAILWHEEMYLAEAIKVVKVNVIENYSDTLKVAVPSFVYYVQNNLLYVGSTNLDAATAQVTYQLKILTTAVFSVLMLNKKLSKIQWTSLVILFLGVALIETMITEPKPPKTEYIRYWEPEYNDTRYDKLVEQDKEEESPFLGFMAILAACVLSGFAGVYFEKILKSTHNVSLWLRNIQLSAASIPIGLVQVFIFEYDFARTRGIFYGFTALTWFCVLLQVSGGIMVAIVVKYANNILKGFATSLAIVISTIGSMSLFNFDLTPTFIVGSSLVMGSVLMYNK